MVIRSKAATFRSTLDTPKSSLRSSSSPSPLPELGAARIGEGRFARGRGWYATFLVLALLLFIAVDHFTGLDAVAATSRIPVERPGACRQ